MYSVYDLQFDDGNIDEMWRHRVTTREARQVLDSDPVFLPNRGEHDAPIVMIGPTFGGRLLTIPLKPIDEEEGIWRPATAYPADGEDETRYWRARGG